MTAALGLCSFTHDSAAALIVDGKLVGLVEEERLTGRKHDPAYPENAIGYLIRQAGVHERQVTDVALHFRHDLYREGATGALAYLARPATARRAIPRYRSYRAVARNEADRVSLLAGHFPNAIIHQVLHHRAHGLTAFAASGWDEAAVLVVDSLGETQTTTIAYGRLQDAVPHWNLVREIGDPASVGYVYGGVTQHLGWRKADEEGTVMALAALGDPARFRAIFAEAMPLTSYGFALNPRWFPLRVVSHRWPRVSPEFIARTCPPRLPGAEITQVHMDLAAALQERTEAVMLHLAELARAATRTSRLCVGGGVAQNCVAIGRIAAAGLFEEVFVPPAPGDSGTALGAALAVNADHGRPVPSGLVRACYLGPQPAHLTPAVAAQPSFTGEAAAAVASPERIADALTEGKIIGVCAGRLEAGPRALGNRSILASPLLPDVADRLNTTVKYREWFRPFAPVVLAESAAEYFVMHGQTSPFMSMAVEGTAHGRRTIPTVFHANNLARVQTLTRRQNPLLHRILQEFAKRAGVPVLINTSLNIKGKPICGTAEMALDCLHQSGIDALVIDGRWFTTNPGEDAKETA